MDVSDGEPKTEDVDGELGVEVDGSKDEVAFNIVVPCLPAMPCLPPIGDVTADVMEEMEVAGSRESVGPVSETRAHGTDSGASIAARGSGLSIVGI